MRYSNRLFLYAPFLVLGLLAILAMLRWWQVAGSLERWLLAANQGHEISPGVTMRFSSERIGGFPFNLDAVLENLTVAVSATRGPFVWHSQHFAMHVLTYGRSQEIFEAAGLQTLSWTDAQGGKHRFALVPGSLRASAITSEGKLVRFDLDLNGIGAPELWGSRAQLHLRRNTLLNAIDFVLSTDDLHLSLPLQTGFGSLIAHLELTGSLRPATTLYPLLAGVSDWRNSVENWRRGGSSFRLEQLELDTGRTAVRGSGSFSLDSYHRATGSLQMTIVSRNGISRDQAGRSPLTAALIQLLKDRSTKVPLPVLIKLNDGRATIGALSPPPSQHDAGSLAPLY